MNTPNPTLAEYVEGQYREEVDFVLKYGAFNPLDLFKIGDIFEATFGFVKDAQGYINYSGLDFANYIDLISTNFGIKEKDLAVKKVLDIKCSMIWLEAQIEQVNEIESMKLGSEPSAEEQRAGVERFEKYRSFLQFDALTGGDILKYEQLRKVPYSKCLMKLMLEADRAEFNERLMKIRSRKNS